MKPKLSIIVPGIRVERWEAVHTSILNSVSCPFELIIISPYALPAHLQHLRHVKYVKDFGNPVRCSNIGLMLCEGEFMTWNADDGDFLPGMIDKALAALEAMPSHPKNVMVCKYMEGKQVVQPDSYFKLVNAYPRVPTIADPDWWIFNLVITRTDYFRSLGGWDANYETLAFAHADMAIRCYRDGCIAEMFHEPIVFNTHGHGDHGPVERGHHDHDDPHYRHVHSDPKNLVPINLTDWMKVESVWRRRNF